MINQTSQFSSSHPSFTLLSPRGQRIYFPTKGIVAQAAEAKGVKINATTGIALDDQSEPFHLPAVSSKISLSLKEVFPYAPTQGLLSLRQEWLQQMKIKNPSLQQVSLPLITAGLTHALHIAAALFIDTHDTLILPDLHWDNYDLIFTTVYEAKIVTYPLFKQGKLNLAGFRQTILGTLGKRIVLLNFPHNPTGYTPTKEEAIALIGILQEAALQRPLVVICDDAYFSFFYEEGLYTESLFAHLSHLHPNLLAIKADGATKEDCTWGLRVAFVTFGSAGLTSEQYHELENKAAGMIRATVSNASNLSQNLVLAALRDPSKKQEIKETLARRYRLVKQIIEDKKYQRYFHPLPCNSGYFFCLELLPPLDAEAVRQRLREKFSTGVISFPPLLRVAYSSVAEKDLPQLFENIYHACQEVQQN